MGRRRAGRRQAAAVRGSRHAVTSRGGVQRTSCGRLAGRSRRERAAFRAAVEKRRVQETPAESCAEGGAVVRSGRAGS